MDLCRLERQQGYNAYMAEVELCHNPYLAESQTQQNVAWFSGWLKARQDCYEMGGKKWTTQQLK